MAKRQQQVTLEDVARKAGVSSMTVSRVINNKGRISDETRQHVLEIADQLGYRPNRSARALVTNRTLLAGFVVPDITNPYFSEAFQGAEDVLREQGYNILVANTNETPEREKIVLGQLGTVDGLISCSSRLPDEELFPLLEHYPAVVSVTRPIPKHIGSAVLSQYKLGYRALEALKYLHETGRRKLGYIGLKHYEMFVDMEEFQLELEQQDIRLESGCYQISEPKWQSGYNAGLKMLRAHPELEGVVGGNDLVALGIMRAALELGRHIPDDLALIGADDIQIASQMTPPLTTYRVDSYENGRVAAQLLLLRMAGDLTYREYMYKTELIIRGST